jgi:hypothetical protein
VLFKFAKLPSGLQDVKEGSCSDSSRDNISSFSTNADEVKSSDERASHSSHQGRCPDEKLGFIMFECGLEGISLKGVKNTESAPKRAEKEETVSVTICNEVVNHRTSSSNLVSEACESDKETTIVCPLESKEDLTTVADVPTSTTPQPPIVEPELVKESLEKVKGKEIIEKSTGAASVSCVIQFTVMWYNFAAPPQTPITRKIDYTRWVIK